MNQPEESKMTGLETSVMSLNIQSDLEPMGWSKNVHEDHLEGKIDFQAFNDIDDKIIEKNYRIYLASGRN